jgi:F0F1-type ATP synthase assembly protein I
MLPSSIAVGVAIGYGLDRWWKTAPIFTLVMALLGVVAGFYNFYKAYTRWERHRRP